MCTVTTCAPREGATSRILSDRVQGVPQGYGGPTSDPHSGRLYKQLGMVVPRTVLGAHQMHGCKCVCKSTVLPAVSEWGRASSVHLRRPRLGRRVRGVTHTRWPLSCASCWSPQVRVGKLLVLKCLADKKSCLFSRWLYAEVACAQLQTWCADGLLITCAQSSSPTDLHTGVLVADTERCLPLQLMAHLLPLVLDATYDQRPCICTLKALWLALGGPTGEAASAADWLDLVRERVQQLSVELAGSRA